MHTAVFRLNVVSCGYSLEMPHYWASNECTFSWKSNFLGEKKYFIKSSADFQTKLTEMKPPFNQSSSFTASWTPNTLSPTFTLAWRISGYWVAEWLPQIMTFVTSTLLTLSLSPTWKIEWIFTERGIHYYAPNFEWNWGCILLCISLSIHLSHFFWASQILRTLHARVLLFYIWVPHEKSWPVFLVWHICTFRSMPPLKTRAPPYGAVYACGVIRCST